MSFRFAVSLNWQFKLEFLTICPLNINLNAVETHWHKVGIKG